MAAGGHRSVVEKLGERAVQFKAKGEEGRETLEALANEKILPHWNEQVFRALAAFRFGPVVLSGREVERECPALVETLRAFLLSESGAPYRGIFLRLMDGEIPGARAKVGGSEADLVDELERRREGE